MNEDYDFRDDMASAQSCRRGRRSTIRIIPRIRKNRACQLNRGRPTSQFHLSQADKSNPVVIEYGIWDGEYAVLPPEVISRYFGDELKMHIQKVRDLTRNERLSTFGKMMPYILLEDFNCVGLEGAIDMFKTPLAGHKPESDSMK